MMNMEQSEESDLLQEHELDEDNTNAGEDVEEIVRDSAEDLMTGMKLDDEIDEVRKLEPGFNWSYHIEIYPWSADDMTENFVRLIKLAQFSQVCMRKKGVGKESDESEKIEDKLSGRQRKGCLHLYTDTWQNAKNIMRSGTWKIMSSKNLTFEITKRGPFVGKLESAYLEMDTYSASKIRFRDKTKGEIKDRSAKVSNLPGTISREFLDVIFSRAYAVIGGTTVKEYLKDKEGKLHEKLSDLKDFNGSIDFDCQSRGSCRAFVLAHKNVFIEGQRVDITANNKETMIVPPTTQNISVKKKPDPKFNTIAPLMGSLSGRGRGSNTGIRVNGPVSSSRGRFNASANGRGFINNNSQHMGREPILNMLPLSRPNSAPFTRSGPMTGRQKMNEKIRRNNFVTAAENVGFGGAGSFAMAGGIMNSRTSVLGSVGDSFKQEIASLQSQLERSTQALEAKIAMLQQTTQNGSYFESGMSAFDNRGWDGNFDYGDGYIQDDSRSAQQHHNYHYNTLSAGQPIKTVKIGNTGLTTAPKGHQGFSRGLSLQGARRGNAWDQKQERRNANVNNSGYW